MNEIIHIAVPIALVVIYIGSAWLWNNKYRPSRQNKGYAVDRFGGSTKRLFGFIFKQDVTPLLPKVKNPFVKKYLKWSTLYVFLLIASLITFIFIPLQSWIPFVIFIVIVLTRAPKVLSDRNKVLTRMLTVANSMFRYSRDASMNPWGYIQVKNWVEKTTPGETVISVPLTWVGTPISRDAFEEQFNQTITDDNSWIFEWNIAKENVIAKPVGHIPTKADYPGSAERPWNEIPLGLGAYGEIVWDVTKEPHALIAGKTGGGKSVAQRNIVFHTIQHNDKWCFLGVDPKRVELKPYKKYSNTVLGIATSLEDMVEVIRYARDEMNNRYIAMEEIGVNHFLDLPTPPRAIMLMVDEAYMLMAPEGSKTDEGKEKDNLHYEAGELIGQIARLGRASGVHLALAMQRPDAVVLKGELKNNLDVRVAAGRLDSTPSSMILDSGMATRVPGDIKGRGVVRIGGNNQQYQGYFATQGWIDEWLMAPQNQFREPEVVTLLKSELGTDNVPDLGNVEDFSELDDFTEPDDSPSEEVELKATPEEHIDSSRMDDPSDFLPIFDEPVKPQMPLSAVKPVIEPVAQPQTPAAPVALPVAPVAIPEPVAEVYVEPVRVVSSPAPTVPSYTGNEKEEIPSLDSLFGAKTVPSPTVVPQQLPPKPVQTSLPTMPAAAPTSNPVPQVGLPPRSNALPPRPTLTTPKPTELPKKPSAFGDNDNFSL